MSLRPFVSERRTVESGGRRFIVRAPTCETVVLACTVFATEIAATVQTWPEIESSSVDPQAVILPSFCEWSKLAHVLPSCVDGDDLKVSLASDKLLGRRMIEAVLSLCDIRAIVSTCSFSQLPGDEGDLPAPPPSADPYAPSPLVRIVDVVARRYGLTPFDVMRWPYEAVMACLGVAAAEVPVSTADRGSPIPCATTDPDALAAMLTMSKGRDRG